MKRIKLFFSFLLVCAALTFTNPVVAQDNTGTRTESTTDVDDDDDDSGNYGLAGLLGLLGLLGLKKKDDDRRRDTTIR